MKFITIYMALSDVPYFTWKRLAGSNNLLGLNKNTDKIPIHPYFTVMDILGFAITIIALTLLTLREPYTLRDPDNFTPSNPLVTPVHIQPE